MSKPEASGKQAWMNHSGTDEENALFINETRDDTDCDLKQKKKSNRKGFDNREQAVLKNELFK
jgi:hypothetical protein